MESPKPPTPSEVRQFSGFIPALEKLTPRQNEVLHWLHAGKPCGEIATILGIRPSTAEEHLRAIYQMLGVENGIAAVAMVTEALEDAYLDLICAFSMSVGEHAAEIARLRAALRAR